MKRILVALDGSEHSKKAANLAIDLAKKYDAKLYIIHVLENKKIPEGFAEFARDERIPSDYFGLVCRNDKFIGEAEAKRIKRDISSRNK